MPSFPGARIATERIFGIAVETVVVVVVVVVVEVVVVAVVVTGATVVVVTGAVIVVTLAMTGVTTADFEIKIHFNFRFTLPHTSLMSETLRTFPALEQRAFSLPVASTIDDGPSIRQTSAKLKNTLFPMFGF